MAVIIRRNRKKKYFLFAPKIKRTLTLSKNIIKLYQIKNKTKNNISRKNDHQNSDLIQARKHVLAKLNASAILNRPSWQPVIQRLEIYGLFHRRRRRRLLRLKCTDSTPPLDIKFFVCGKTRATILPRENFITIHTQIFTLRV